MKEEIRREMLGFRLALSEARVRRDSEMIVATLLSLPCVRDAQRVMAYCAIQNEPDVWAFAQAMLDRGKRLALPSVAPRGIVAVEYRRDTRLVRGPYGIAQPEVSADSAPFEPDLVITPGVVFDLRCYRIGFGAGYYDRFLENNSAVKVGVCFESQLVDAIETEPHDVRMDCVVTESRVLEAP